MIEFNTTLVAQQGQIDRIEFDMSSAFDYVASAHQQVDKAIEYKKSASKKKIFIIITVCVIVAVIVIILVVKFSKK